MKLLSLKKKTTKQNGQKYLRADNHHSGKAIICDFHEAYLYIVGKTRPDSRQSNPGWLGRSGDAKTARNRKINAEILWRDGGTDGRTDGPTRQGVESRVRD